MLSHARFVLGGSRILASVPVTTSPRFSLNVNGLCTKIPQHEPTVLPTESDVVVIGGGVMGCFTLYQLTRLGCSALLLERSQLTAGTTWHTNGLVWRIRPGDIDTAILNTTRTAVLDIEKEEPAGWTTNGGLFIANNITRLEEYSRLYTLGRTAGVECEILGPRELSDLFPMMEVGDVTGALYSPGDGTLDPSTLCRALTNRAKLSGAQVCEGVSVTGIETVGGVSGRRTVKAIETNRGRVQTQVIVNCTGVWGADILRFAGIEEGLPMVAMKHSMVVMDAIPGVRTLPNVRDHDANMCLRIQGDSFVIGGYELNAFQWEEVEPDFSFGLFDFDMDAFSEIFEGAVHRVPRLSETGIKATICGPEAFTPDRKPLIGEDGEVSGLYHGLGFNSAGMMLAGGCSEQLAQWVVHDRPSLDMSAYDCRRFATKVRQNREWAWERSHESYTKNYSIVFPRDQPLAGREAITDPLYSVLTDAGCFWEEARGWERPAFFTGNATPLLGYDWMGAFGQTRHEKYSYRDTLHQSHTFGLPYYYKQVEYEYLALRDASAVINHSSSGKMLLSGPDAHKAVAWLSLSEIKGERGFGTSSFVLNTDGGVEADVTVHSLDPDARLECEVEAEYLITCGSGLGPVVRRLLRDMCWSQNFRVSFRCTTHQIGILTLFGPGSYNVIQSVGIDVTNIQHNRHQFVTLKGRNLRLFRRSTTCWEIHTATDDIVDIYKQIMGADVSCKPVNAGYYALNIYSLEQGIPSWLSDLRRGDTPVEAGFWNAREERNNKRHFLGRDALLRQATEGVNKSRVILQVSGCQPLWGGEAILRDGERVGGVRRADHSFKCGGPLAVGYVKHEKTEPQNARQEFRRSVWEVERMGKRYPALLYEL